MQVNARNQGDNGANQSVNAGNKGGNARNKGGNAGNRVGNAVNGIEIEKDEKKVYKIQFFFPEIEKEKEIRIVIKR